MVKSHLTTAAEISYFQRDLKNSVLTFLSEQEKVSDTIFLIANGSWYQCQFGKTMAVPVPFQLTILI